MIKRLLEWLTGSSRLKALQKENQELRAELVKRQEAINKTNAYWKGVLRKTSVTKR
jgi:hypothetical protein